MEKQSSARALRRKLRSIDNDQFIVKVANTLNEAVKLMEVGLEYHADVEGNKLFRKRK
jgi:hypothetical protein